MWKRFAEALGRVMSWIILSILWIVGFGIYAIVLKTMNTFKSQQKPISYWVDPPQDFPNSMKYQF